MQKKFTQDLRFREALSWSEAPAALSHFILSLLHILIFIHKKKSKI